METNQKYNESGLCLCGCGQKTRISEITRPQQKIFKGDHFKYVRGHNLTGTNNLRFKGWRYLKDNGYIKVKSINHLKADSFGYIYEHILYAEQILGKSLPENAVIHHVDGDKTKQVSNLVICEDHAYHVLLHRRMKAKRKCGHATWLKCRYCHQYDDPGNMNIKYYSRINGRRQSATIAYHVCCRRAHWHESGGAEKQQQYRDKKRKAEEKK